MDKSRLNEPLLPSKRRCAQTAEQELQAHARAVQRTLIQVRFEMRAADTEGWREWVRSEELESDPS